MSKNSLNEKQLSDTGLNLQEEKQSLETVSTQHTLEQVAQVYKSNIDTVKEKTGEYIIKQLKNDPQPKDLDTLKKKIDLDIDGQILGIHSKFSRAEDVRVEDLYALGQLYGDRATAQNGIIVRRDQTEIPLLNVHGDTKGQRVVLHDCRLQDLGKVTPANDMPDVWSKAAIGLTAGTFNLIDNAINKSPEEKLKLKKDMMNAWSVTHKQFDALGNKLEIESKAREAYQAFEDKIATVLTKARISIPGKGENGLLLDDPKKLMKKVTLYRDYAQLKMEDQNICTISAPAGEHKRINVQAEIGMNSCPQDTKKELDAAKELFDKIAQENPKVKSDFNKLSLLAKKAPYKKAYDQLANWLKIKEPSEQKCILDNIDNIKNGKIVTSQISDTGMVANGYLHNSLSITEAEINKLKNPQTQEQEEKKVHKKIALQMPTANPAHLKGSERYQIDMTKRKMKYLQDLGGDKFQVNHTCVTTSFPWPFNKFIKEAKIVNRTTQASKELKKEKLKQGQAGNEYNQVAFAAPTDKLNRIEKGLTQVKEAVKRQTDTHKLQDVIDALKPPSRWDKLKTALGLGKKEEEKKIATIVNFFCKSGKDRTGAGIRIVDQIEQAVDADVRLHLQKVFGEKVTDLVTQYPQFFGKDDDGNFKLSAKISEIQKDKDAYNALKGFTESVSAYMKTEEFKTKLSEYVKDNAESIILAAHGSRVTGGPGGTYGCNDLKLSGVLKGLPKNHYLRQYKEHLTGALSECNHGETRAEKSDIEKQIKEEQKQGVVKQQTINTKDEQSKSNIEALDLATPKNQKKVERSNSILSEKTQGMIKGLQRNGIDGSTLNKAPVIQATKKFQENKKGSKEAGF